MFFYNFFRKHYFDVRPWQGRNCKTKIKILHSKSSFCTKIALVIDCGFIYFACKWKSGNLKYITPRRQIYFLYIVFGVNLVGHVYFIVITELWCQIRKEIPKSRNKYNALLKLSSKKLKSQKAKKPKSRKAEFKWEIVNNN